MDEENGIHGLKGSGGMWCHAIVRPWPLENSVLSNITPIGVGHLAMLRFRHVDAQQAALPVGSSICTPEDGVTNTMI